MFDFVQRVSIRLLRFFAVVVFYLWILKLLYLLVWRDYYPGYGGTARFYLSFRDSFFGLPDTVLYGFVYFLQLISGLHHTLISQLGYDPFSIATEFRPFGTFAVSSIEFGRILDQAIYGATVVALVLSLFQVFALFLINAMGVSIGWRFVCLPCLLNVRAHVAFNVLALVVATSLAVSAFEVGTAAGVTGVLVAAFLLRWPLPAGFLAWLLMLLGLQPRVLSLFLLSLVGQFWRFRSKNDENDAPLDLNEDGFGQWQDDELDEQLHLSSMATNANADALLETACKNFNMSVDEFMSADFERDTLVFRFRELAKKLHPDAHGSEELMRVLNRDFEHLLKSRGWRR